MLLIEPSAESSPFSSVSRDEKIGRAIAPAVDAYLAGFEEKDPAVHAELLSSLGEITIRRPDLVVSLRRFLERSDVALEDRMQASDALAALTAPPAADGTTGAKSASGIGPGRARRRE